MPDSFRFAPELFEQRAAALEALEEAGFTFFTDFRAVDLDHKYYGVSIGGIAERATAQRILAVLRPRFPGYSHCKVSRGYCDREWPYLVELLRESKQA